MSTPAHSPKRDTRDAVRRSVDRARGTAGRRYGRALFVLGAALALTLGVGAGTAYAWFTSSGSGTGKGSVSTAQAVTVLGATGTPTSALHPGATADLTLTVKNPNSYPLVIVSISQNLTSAETVVGGTGCTAGNSGVTVPTLSGLDVTVTSGTSVVVHIPNGAAMSASSASGCQGASFHVPVHITVRRQ